MKKQFSPRRNYSASDGSGIAKTLWGFGIVILIGIIFVLLKIFVPDVFIAMASPFWKFGSSIDSGIGNDFSGFGNATKLAKENIALAEQVDTLQNENAVLTARAQDLTKMLSDSAALGANQTILAGVLAAPPLSPYDTLVVAQGSQSGVKVSAEVFANGGIPIGTVKKVTTDSATVQLISTPGVVTNGWVGENRVPLTLTGMGAGAFTATLPTAASVSVGDTVYVPGPGAVPLGTIIKIDTDPSSPTAILHIQSFVNIFSITWVQISNTAL